MKKTLFSASAFAAAILAAQIVSALQFSADVVNTSREGTMRGRAYVTDNAARIDMPGVGASITRMDQKRVIVLMEGERMYMEQPFDIRAASYVGDRVDGEVSRVLLGSESIDGRPAKKYMISAESNGVQAKIYQWIDDATLIPLRTDDADGNWSVEYKNLKTGPQDPRLFEIPAGYRKFTMPNMSDIKALMAQAGQDR
jgi:hypothetical protein